MSVSQWAEGRDIALENAIATNEIEGVEFTPEMRALLERAIRSNMSDDEFSRAVMELTHGQVRNRS